MRRGPRIDRPPLPYSARRYLVTQAERRFFHALRTAVGERYLIALKVRLADVISCSGEKWRSGYGGAISQKHLDFVLVTPETLRIILCIELDDRSHERLDRQKRDAFVDDALHGARVPLVRIRAARVYDPSRIRGAVIGAVLHPAVSRVSTARPLRARRAFRSHAPATFPSPLQRLTPRTRN